MREGVSAGQTDVDFVLTRIGALAGSVKDAETGVAIKPFVVEAVPERADLRLFDSPTTGIVKDERGFFTLEELPPGPYRLVVKAQGWLPHESAVEVKPGEWSQVDVTLDRGARITGTVVNSRGQPVAGAKLKVVALVAKGLKGAGAPQDGAGQGVSGPEGTFAITGLFDGLYQVQATHPRYAPGESIPAVATLDPEVPVPELRIVLGDR
jgi:hypothetical protein